jgi:hypothetical protein
VGRVTRLQQRAAALERERGLQRLRRWTTACVVGAAALVAFFAVLAAGSFPGRATASDTSGGATSGGATPGGATSGAQPSDGSATPSQPADQSPGQSSDQPAAPGGGYFGSGGGGGHHGFATSGGS